jgi:hypothetical protein
MKQNRLSSWLLSISQSIVLAANLINPPASLDRVVLFIIVPFIVVAFLSFQNAPFDTKQRNFISDIIKNKRNFNTLLVNTKSKC